MQDIVIYVPWGEDRKVDQGRRVRLSHTTGGIVAVLSVGGLTTNDDDAMDLVKSSRERMQFMQHWIEDVSMKTKGWIVNAWPDMK